MNVARLFKTRFAWRLTLATAALTIAAWLIQLALYWAVFGDTLVDAPDLQRDLAVVFAIGAVLMVAWIALIFILVRNFVLPINSLAQSITSAIDGEIGHKVDVRTEDEVGVLGTSYNQLVDLIVYLLHQSRESSKRLAQSSNDILAATEQQASGSAEQAASITQTTATMEELASTYRQIAENADQVVSMAEASLGNAESGQRSVLNTLGAMEEIRTRTQQSANKILELGERSQQIGQVLAIINTIADQTKILALNAAIEAARAGDAGKGFSVVAAEIRKLADSVVESTSEISGIMGEIQTSANELVLSTEQELRQVQSGVDLAQSTGDSFESILDTIERTTVAAKEISAATQQQRSATDQVVKVMRDVAAVAQQTAAGSAQVAGSAETLSTMARESSQVGAGFKIVGL